MASEEEMGVVRVQLIVEKYNAGSYELIRQEAHRKKWPATAHQWNIRQSAAMCPGQAVVMSLIYLFAAVIPFDKWSATKDIVRSY